MLPNIFFCVPHLMSDKRLNLYKITGNIIVSYILIFTIFNSRKEGKRVQTQW
jgi:hypothetical protein